MSLTLPRRRALCALLAAAPLAAAPALAAPSAADAAAVHACKAKRGGAIRLVAKKAKCRRGEKKLSWSTTGPRGRSGAPGTAGAPGAPGARGADGAPGAKGADGLAARAFRFSAAQPGALSPAPIALFSADGISYTFRCQNAVLVNVGEIEAGGAEAISYGSGVLRRPTGVDALPGEPTTGLRTVTLAPGRTTDVAAVTTLAESERSIQQLGVWHVTVEGPTATTFITASFDTAATCSVRGSALTVPLPPAA